MLSVITDHPFGWRGGEGPRVVVLCQSSLPDARRAPGANLASDLPTTRRLRRDSSVAATGMPSIVGMIGPRNFGRTPDFGGGQAGAWASAVVNARESSGETGSGWRRVVSGLSGSAREPGACGFPSGLFGPRVGPRVGVCEPVLPASLHAVLCGPRGG